MSPLAIGQTVRTSRTFTAEDIAAYRALAGDAGLHFGSGATAAQETVPGPLLGGMFSNLLGTRLPGPGTNWLKQSLAFPQAARLGEEITAVVQITRLRPEKGLVNLQTTCVTKSGDCVCSGEALVLVRELK